MDVVALVPARDHPSTRYRISQFSQYLERVGLGLQLEPIAVGIADRFRQMSRNRSNQVVLIQRKLLPLWQLALLRQSSRILIYDFDDAVYVRDSFHPRGPYSWTRAVRFRATVSMADYVLAGNRYLADETAKWTDPRKIHVVPTCVDSGRYQPAVHDDHRQTRLVWIGSSSTLRSLEKARPLFEEIGQAIPGTILRVICDRFPHFEHLRVEKANWSGETETTDLGDADIGISWIPDDLWSRGKCGLKVLQYMAAGLPVVASPVGVHPELVSQGQGFLPSSSRDWIDRINLLAQNPQLREQMGREGRSRQERRFNVETWGPVLADRLAEAATRL